MLLFVNEPLHRMTALDRRRILYVENLIKLFLDNQKKYLRGKAKSYEAKLEADVMRGSQRQG